jgi:maleylacetate reductase
MGLHNRICHVLGGAYGLPHAATHAVILPYSVEFNRGFAPALEELAPYFGDGSIAMGIARFAHGLGAPRNLAELGFRKEMMDGAIGSILTDPVANPRAVTAAAVAEILAKALLGQDPQ